jgi:hypothetical protein
MLVLLVRLFAMATSFFRSPVTVMPQGEADKMRARSDSLSAQAASDFYCPNDEGKLFAVSVQIILVCQILHTETDAVFVFFCRRTARRVVACAPPGAGAAPFFISAPKSSGALSSHARRLWCRG